MNTIEGSVYSIKVGDGTDNYKRIVANANQVAWDEGEIVESFVKCSKLANEKGTKI